MELKGKCPNCMARVTLRATEPRKRRSNVAMDTDKLRKRLLDVCEVGHYSFRGIAELSGLSTATISRFASGAEISMDTFGVLSEFLYR